MHLLDAVWPPDGLHCLVSISPSGQVRHYWSDRHDLKATFEELRRQQTNVFFGLGTFGTPERRQANVTSLKAFWLDVDAGPSKPYPTLAAALEALKDFIHAAGLPPPWVVQSGVGAHVYWPLESPVLPTMWKPVAERLRAACEKAGFTPGHERTVDSASILRVPGAWHVKDPANPKPVRMLREGGLVDFMMFSRALEKFIPADKTRTPALVKSVNESMSAQVYAGYRPSAHAIAGKCQQLADFAVKKGAVSEPFWYAAIQLLRFTNESPGIIHEWSAGDPRYDAAQVDAKIHQLEEKGIGPTTCERMQAVAGQGEMCLRCPFHKKIVTPLALGVEVEKAPVAPALPGAPSTSIIPAPFFTDTQGRVGVRNPSTHVDEIIYPYPLQVMQRLKDDAQEYVMLKTHLPQDGWQDVLIPLSSLYSRTGIAEELAARGVLLDRMYIDTATAFITESVKKLQEQQRAAPLITRMGWGSDEAFTLGKTFLSPDAPPRQVVTANASLSRGFMQRGSLSEWNDIVRHYEHAPLEWQVAFLTAFAAPLVALTGFGGMTVNMVGRTGIGKSTVQKAVASVYGAPDLLMAQKHDTLMTIMHRLGFYNSVPLCVDEMTNIKSEEISDFLYQVSQGRERARLTPDAMLRPEKTWNTLVLTSSNASLLSRLSAAKSDFRAESMRLWEMQMPEYAEKGQLDYLHTGVMAAHFGVAGVAFAEWVVKNRARVLAVYQGLLAKSGAAWGVQTPERYWEMFGVLITTAATALSMMQWASFDAKALWIFFGTQIAKRRRAQESISSQSVLVLGSFLDATIRERVVVPKETKDTTILPLPTGITALTSRFESYSGVLYISEERLRRWLEERKAAPLPEIWSEWERLQYEPANVRKVLGEGFAMGGAAVKCVRLKIGREGFRLLQSQTPAPQPGSAAR